MATVYKAITWSGQTREKDTCERMYIDCIDSHRNTEGAWMIPGVACVLITVRKGFILPSITCMFTMSTAHRCRQAQLLNSDPFYHR